MFEAQEVHYAHIGAVAITKLIIHRVSINYLKYTLRQARTHRRCLLNKCLGLRSELLTLPIECLCPLVLT